MDTGGRKARIKAAEQTAKTWAYIIDVDAQPTKWKVTLRDTSAGSKRTFTGTSEQSSYGIFTNDDMYETALIQAVQMMTQYETRNA